MALISEWMEQCGKKYCQGRHCKRRQIAEVILYAALEPCKNSWYVEEF
jgi:hypothetical protein